MGEEEHGMLAHAAQIGVHLLHPPLHHPEINQSGLSLGPHTFKTHSFANPGEYLGLKSFPQMASVSPSHIHNKGPYFLNCVWLGCSHLARAGWQSKDWVPIT